MATPSTATHLSGLALRLVREKLLDTADAEALQIDATKKNIPFVTHLVASKKIDSATVARVASQEFGVPLFDLNSLDLDSIPVKLVADKIIDRHRVLPMFKRGTKLFIAIADPTNVLALDEIKFNTGLSIEGILVEEDKLSKAIDNYTDSQDTSMSDFGDDDGLEDLDITSGEAEADTKNNDDGVNDTPIVKFVNKVLMDAIKSGASDIHMEPYEKSYRVRFRRDGMLEEIATPPLALAHKITARIKILAKLDIAERRLPQDGRMKLRISKNKAIDFRVNSLPTLFGEKIVMRILDPTSATLGVDKLGFEPEQKEALLKAAHSPYGMLLVTGPTGSGKTVTLYTCVNILNTPETNISTAEDPVEINLPGVNQVNINERIGLDFGSALRAFLRQDPDIILVGEIRDIDTASIAIKAAQTGHMVLSTLHTNSAPATLSRLVNMGVPPFNIASAVNLIVAQRLGRRLCESCKQPVSVPDEALIAAGFKENELDGLTLYGPKGCSECGDSGYKGRVGIYEVMPITAKIGEIIMSGGTELDIEKQMLSEGVSDLRTSALRKVRAGVTSLEEVARVTLQ